MENTNLSVYLLEIKYALLIKAYSHPSNKREGWNKRRGGAKVVKSINVEVGINVEGGIFWKKTSTLRLGAQSSYVVKYFEGSNAVRTRPS